MVEAEQRIAIETRDGTRHVGQDEIIKFSEGLPGFERYTEYAVFDINGCPPFKSMLSIEKGGPDFVVIDPGDVFRNYEPFTSLPQFVFPGQSPSIEVAVLSIVTLTDDPADSTVNLRGPIIIDLATRSARQVVLSDETYSTREPLMTR